MIMIYVYIAGPLFSEADIRQRKYEARQIEAVLAKQQQPYFIANPIDLPLDLEQVPAAADIFRLDYQHICQANVFFLELASNDSGTLAELGIIIERYMQGREIGIYPVFYDLRLSRNSPSGVECPVGFNSFTVGCLRANDIVIYESFAQALTQFDLDLKSGMYGKQI